MFFAWQTFDEFRDPRLLLDQSGKLFLHDLFELGIFLGQLQGHELGLQLTQRLLDQSLHLLFLLLGQRRQGFSNLAGFEQLIILHAVEQIGKLAATTDAMLNEEGKPLMADLRKSVQSATRSIDTLDKTIGAAQPGVEAFSTQTMPEVNQLVRDLREMSRAFRGVAEKLDQQGAGSLVGSPKLPDYKP